MNGCIKVVGHEPLGIFVGAVCEVGDPLARAGRLALHVEEVLLLRSFGLHFHDYSFPRVTKLHPMIVKIKVIRL